MPEDRTPATPVRSFWSGTITFGLVSIPVELYAAARGRRTSMKLVDEQGHALGRRYVSTRTGRVLTPEELVRGFEHESGRTVIVTDEELESVAPERSRDIQLDRFVPVDRIPPSVFQRPYYLAPDERAGKAYALLAQTMERTGRAAIGEFVMREREYLVAIVAEGGVLRAETLRYGDEIRSAQDVGLPAAAAAPRARVQAFEKAIDALAEDALDWDELEDLEAEALRQVAGRKARERRDVIALEALEDDDADGEGGAEVIDLMQLLRRSLGGEDMPPRHRQAAGTVHDLDARREARRSGDAPAGAKKGTAKKATARTADDKPAPEKKAAAKKATAKKVAARKTPVGTTPAKKPTKKPAKKPAANKGAAANAPAGKAAARKSAGSRAPRRKAAAKTTGAARRG